MEKEKEARGEKEKVAVMITVEAAHSVSCPTPSEAPEESRACCKPRPGDRLALHTDC